MSLVFIDTETTGLDPERHEVWEIAYAIEDGPVEVSTVRHDNRTADPVALKVNGYIDRVRRGDGWWHSSDLWEIDLKIALAGAVIVASNPSFDTAMLRARWGFEPWHHRKIDIATLALPITGWGKNNTPKGLYDIAADLDIQAPDHTAAGDVHTLRECYRELWRRFDALQGGEK